MKIKTIWEYYPGEFDREVNKLLAQGWKLVRREVITEPKGPLKNAMFYAELILEDPEEQSERQLWDPLDAVRGIKALCTATSNEDCVDERCPLSDWCTRMIDATERHWVTPDNWTISEKEGGQV